MLLGQNYAKRGRLFLGINPGPTGRDRDPFKTVPCPKNVWDETSSEFAYHRNLHKLVHSRPELICWSELATAAFCVPWRTKDTRALKTVNAETGGELFRLSGDLLRTMIRHHQAADPSSTCVVIAAGAYAVQLLARVEFLHFDARQMRRHGSGTYACGRLDPPNRRLQIIRVPHFSRASSKVRLAQAAAWVVRELNLRQ